MEPLTLSQRWRWLKLVWSRYFALTHGKVVVFSPVVIRGYRWKCIRVTVALILNREREPYDFGDFQADKIMAYDNVAPYQNAHGGGESWDYIQLARWCRFIFFSNSRGYC